MYSLVGSHYSRRTPTKYSPRNNDAEPCHPAVDTWLARKGRRCDAATTQFYRGRRNRGTGAQLSLRDLPRAGQHDHRQAAAESRCRGQRTVRPPGPTARDVDQSQRLHRPAANLGPAQSPRRKAHFGRLVPDAQQGVDGRIRLHAGPHPQPRRQRIALVLHAALRSLRHTSRRIGAFSAQAFLGAPVGHVPPRPGSSTRLSTRREPGNRISSASTCRTSTTPHNAMDPTAPPPIRRWPSWTNSWASSPTR